MNKATFMRWFWRAVGCILAAQVALMLYLLVAIIGTQGALIAVSILLIAQSVNVWWLVRKCDQLKRNRDYWRMMHNTAAVGRSNWHATAIDLQARLAPFERVKDERGRFVARDRAA